MIHQVTGCMFCPFETDQRCLHPKSGAESVSVYVNNFGEQDGDPYPVWCPLKKEDIVIKLVKK